MRVPELELLLRVQEQRIENSRGFQTFVELRTTKEALSCMLTGSLGFTWSGMQTACEMRPWVLSKLWTWSLSASGEHQVRAPH